jgi:hypothetical protein
MGKRISLSRAFVSLFFLLAGCISTDSRMLKEVIDEGATRNITGDFSNQATYRTAGNPNVNLAEVFGSSTRYADKVRIALESEGVLKMTWYIKEEEKSSLLFLPEVRYTFNPKGEIEFLSKGRWFGKEGGYGYGKSGFCIFINVAGDLVLVESGGGLGVYGPIPIAAYGQFMAIFPRRAP